MYKALDVSHIPGHLQYLINDIFLGHVTETFQNYASESGLSKVAGQPHDQTQLTAWLDFLFDSSLEIKMAKSTTNSINNTAYFKTVWQPWDILHGHS